MIYGAAGIGGAIVVGYSMYRCCRDVGNDQPIFPTPKTFMDKQLDHPSIYQLDRALSDVIQFLHVNPDILKTEGLFREPGSASKIQALYEQSLDVSDFLTELGQNRWKMLFSEHDIMGMCTRFIRQSHEHFRISEHELTKLNALITQGSCANEVGLWFKKLSERLCDEGYLVKARCIHDLFYLAHLIQQHQNKNKMTSSNLARVYRPNFERMFGVTEPTSMAELTNHQTTYAFLGYALQLAIESDIFIHTFNQSYDIPSQTFNPAVSPHHCAKAKMD